jgi:hypothetical protein
MLTDNMSIKLLNILVTTGNLIKSKGNLKKIHFKGCGCDDGGDGWGLKLVVLHFETCLL